MQPISFLHPCKYIASLFFLLFVATAPSVIAQWVPQNAVIAVEQQPDGAVLVLQTGFLRFEVCANSIVHVVYSVERDAPKRTDFLVTKKSWPKADFSLHTDDPKLITVTTSRLKIEVNGEKTYHSERFVNMWDTQEAFYGLGQHQAGVWNYRGESVDLSQDNTNISIPFLLSSNGYGIFWNNGSRSRFNNRFVHAFYLSSDVADAMDYYFFYGPDFDRLIADYRELTGAAPLFGKWAYGYWQCKNRYDSQQELFAI